MNNELILYTSDDGSAKIYLKNIEGTAWLNQYEIAELFGVDRSVIVKHINNIYREQELLKSSTCAKFAQVQNEGTRTIKRQVEHYNLNMILAIGLRVRSLRGQQFRLWAINNLKDYIIKGFVINSDQLKEVNRYNYFDELLEQIRDIRGSEKRFYQKVRELFALSYDYVGNEEETSIFFATVQNKLLFAVTGKTAAEIVLSRANPNVSNMGLTNFSGSIVRKTDIYIGKNYLFSHELEELNRLVSMFLDFAETKVSRKEKIMLADWKNYVDSFVAFNDYPLLNNAGKISHESMKNQVEHLYIVFDKNRKKQEAIEADKKDNEEFESIVKGIMQKKKELPYG